MLGRTKGGRIGAGEGDGREPWTVNQSGEGATGLSPVPIPVCLTWESLHGAAAALGKRNKFTLL